MVTNDAMITLPSLAQVLYPPMLIVALLAPGGLTALAKDVPVEAQMLPLFVLKVTLMVLSELWVTPTMRCQAVITSAYCSAGVGKLWASYKAGVFWGNGATLQYYCFEVFVCLLHHGLGASSHTRHRHCLSTGLTHLAMRRTGRLVCRRRVRTSSRRS